MTVRAGGGLAWWAYLLRGLAPGDYEAGVLPALARDSASALATVLYRQGELIWSRRAGEPPVIRRMLALLAEVLAMAVWSRRAGAVDPDERTGR